MKKTQGKCAVCGGDLEYLDSEFQEGAVAVLVACRRCGCLAKEIYNATYCGTEVDVKKEIDYLDKEIVAQIKLGGTELRDLMRKRLYYFDYKGEAELL